MSEGMAVEVKGGMQRCVDAKRTLRELGHLRGYSRASFWRCMLQVRRRYDVARC